VPVRCGGGVDLELSPQLGRRRTDLRRVRLSPVDDEYNAEYWARQLRLGTWIAVGVTVLGAVRVMLDWGPADRWWVAPLTAAAAAQALTAFVPWERAVHNRRVREWLILWWVAELPLITVFAAVDSSHLVAYIPLAMLVVILCGALFPPRTVVGIGGLSMAGYLLLVPWQAELGATMVVGLAAMLAVITGLCAATAANRDTQVARRRALERRTEALLETSSDAVLAIDGGGALVYASPSVRRLFGHEPGWLTGPRLGEMAHPDDLPKAREWMANLHAAPPGSTARIEARIRRADGGWLVADIIGVNRMDMPELRAAVLSVRDIGVRRALEEELTRQAFADSLTGLANRALFRDRVGHAVARHRRGDGRVTVLLIDLDDFKVTNDSLGHTAGDELLCTLAGRLREVVRPSDTLARLGGDEFAVLVEDLDDLETAALADRIRTALRRPVRLGTRDVVCTVSVGVATAKAGDGEQFADDLLRNADLAMYAAKNGGRDRYAVFDPAMYAGVLREAQQRADMERALVEEEFTVHYQPIVDLPNRRITGFEALVRWEHPRDGMVAPGDFIPAAETTGLIVPLGRWVLRRACEQLARWQAELPAAGGLSMSVNLSARQFQYDGLVADVAAALADSGIRPSSLVLEITESILMHDTDATLAALRSLKELGVRLAIDDFGTGYSSLSYVKQFPVDILKIDRSFVDGVGTDAGSATLAEAMVQLGHAMRLQTLAEGIETADDWSALRTLGCQYGQGFLFAKPVEPVEIEALLARGEHALEA
jgi:diguanylate cyclase (GGDEF)-like protein/PAS domain S-box-containing protein